MEELRLLDRAVLENAGWCDLVCRAHASPGRFHDAYWIDPGPVPPYHPRLITLAGPARVGEQQDAVRVLLEAAPGEAFAVKDSYRALDLAPAGFRRLFESEWIAWPSDRAPPDTAGPIRWAEVRDEAALARWEDAWRGAPPPAGLAGVRMFPAGLLREPDVVFLGGERGGRIVGTGVLHRSDGVVGLSNVTGDAGASLRACTAFSRRRFPGLHVVGYERGAELEAALAAGFTRLGPLAVWERNVSAP